MCGVALSPGLVPSTKEKDRGRAPPTCAGGRAGGAPPYLARRRHVGVDGEEGGAAEQQVVHGGELAVKPDVDVDHGDAHQLVHAPAQHSVASITRREPQRRTA